MPLELCNQCVINSDYGGFDLSPEAIAWLRLRCPGVTDTYEWHDQPRNAKALVEAVKWFNKGGSLRLVRVDPARRYTIYKCDGKEWLCESHQVYDTTSRRWRWSHASNGSGPRQHGGCSWWS